MKRFGARVILVLGAAALGLGALLTLDGDERASAPQAIASLTAARATTREAAELGVLFSGCTLVRSGPLCELEPGQELILWLEANADERHSMTLAGEHVEPAARRVVEAGLQYRVPVRALPTTLVVQAAGGASFRLELAATRAFPDLERADALRRSGQVKEALELVERSMSKGSDEERNRARALRARIDLAQGNAKNAAVGLRESADEAERLGRISDAMKDTFALAFVEIIHLSDLDAAAATLARGRAWAGQDPSALGWHQHFSGLLAQKLGDARGARARFEQAASYAARLDDPLQRRDSTVFLAQIAADVGELSQAVGSLEQLLGSDSLLRACDLGWIHRSLAWIGMEAEQRLRTRVDIERQLEEAERHDATCGSPYNLRLDAINAGLWALERRDLAAARRELAELKAIAGGQTTELLVWQLELEGRIALESGRAAPALELFERAGLLSDSRGDRDGQLRAHIGRGEAFERLGDPARALAAFHSADALVAADQQAFFAGSQRDGFLGRRDGALRALVSALVRRGDVRGAFKVISRAFERALGHLALRERGARMPEHAREAWMQHLSAYHRARAEIEALSVDDWQLSTNQIRQRLSIRQQKAALAEEHLLDAWRLLGKAPQDDRAPLSAREGQILLALFPAKQGWFAFTGWKSELRVQHFGSLEELASADAGGSARVLEPVRELLPLARELAIVGYGAAQSVDFALLPHNGRPLAEALPLRHRLGLQTSGPAPSAERHIAVVADPNEDLPRARGEAQDVASLWASARVETLIGPRAQRDAVLGALGTATLFHYAGHALPASRGLLDGLPLSQGGVLAPSDVLALPRVPNQVILAACDAGRGAEVAWAGGWSLAHAFVVAGAREVVAPVRDVDDRHAARLITLFHEALAREHADPLPADGSVTWDESGAARALHVAQRHARREGLMGWEAFRVFSP